MNDEDFKLESGASVSKKKTESLVPTIEPAKRVAKLFHRQPTTAWSAKEIRKFKSLYKIGYFRPDELQMVEDYYKAERKKGSDGIHRRDLCTFLNNYPGEVDRAGARRKRVDAIKAEKIVPPKPPELSDEEFERNRQFVKGLTAKLRESFKMPDYQRTELPPIVEEAKKIFNGTLVQ